MFITELWESVLTPGTSPALIQATHGSFILLIISLISLIWLTRSIHFINLLVIAILLWGTVIWFISELAKAKLQTNEELEKEAEAAKKDEVPAKLEPVAVTSGLSISSPVKSRKA